MEPVDIIIGIPANMEEVARRLGMSHTLDPGENYTKANCPECNGQMWVGPHQEAVFKADPGHFLIMCLPCAGRMTIPVEVHGLWNPGGMIWREL